MCFFIFFFALVNSYKSSRFITICNESNLKNENKIKDFYKIPNENCDEKNQKKKTIEKVDIRDEKEIEENILNCNKTTRLIGVYDSEEKNEKTQITDIEKILSKKINCEAVEDENSKRKSKSFSFSSTKKRNKIKGEKKKKKEVVSFGRQNEEYIKQNILGFLFLSFLQRFRCSRSR